jgi:hypothetical protein
LNEIITIHWKIKYFLKIDLNYSKVILIYAKLPQSPSKVLEATSA